MTKMILNSTFYISFYGDLNEYYKPIKIRRALLNYEIDEKLEIVRKQQYLYVVIIIVIIMQITFLLTIPSIQNYSKDAQQLQQYDRYCS